MPDLLDRETLAGKVKAAETIIKEWEASDDPRLVVIFSGRETKMLSEAIEEAWQGLAEAVGTDRIDPEAQELTLEVDAFLDELERFKNRASIHDEKVNPGGTVELWNAWSGLVDAAEPPVPRPPLEPIAELRAANVPTRQIALMYEFFDRNGQPDIGKVNEEIASPGTHYDPETHVPGVVRRHRARIAEKWETRSSRRRQIIDLGSRKPEEKSFIDAPESIEDLLRQRVSSKQISLMKGVDQQTVKDMARELGMPVDGQVPPPALSANQHLAKVKQKEADRMKDVDQRAAAAKLAETVQSYPELPTVKERVRQMTYDGVDVQTIHQVLSLEDPSVKINSVRQHARNALKDQPQAAE